MPWHRVIYIASTHDRLFMLKTPHAHFIEIMSRFIEMDSLFFMYKT